MGFVLVIMVVGTIILYGIETSKNELPPLELALILAVLIIAGLAAVIFSGNLRNFRAGLPIKDEMEKKIWYKAGYYSYLVTIYLALGLSMLSDYLIEDMGISGFDIGVVIGIIILVSSIVFIGLYFYFKHTGKTD